MDEEYSYKREAQAYQYLNDKFEVLHQTSVHSTDQDALEYFNIIQVWFHDQRVTYCQKRAESTSKFQLMPFVYNPDTREVTPFEQSEVLRALGQ